MQMSFDLPAAQRWRNREEMLVLPDTRINPNEYGVEVLEKELLPRQLIEQHHYSGSFPAAICSIGLYRKTGVHPSHLAGVAVFSEGVRSHDAMPRWTGHSREEGTELGRFVLLPEVAYNGESWFIARAFELLRKARPEKKVVLSYCDPMPRTDETGRVVKPGHFGCIYQATNALFVGHSSKRMLHMRRDGRVIHDYTFYKAANPVRGSASAIATLEELGSRRSPGEKPTDWVSRVKSAMRRIRHPGNFVYVFAMAPEAKAKLREMHGDGLPYPKEATFRSAA